MVPDVPVVNLDQYNCDAVRKAREAHLIHKGNTLSPLGMNRRDKADWYHLVSYTKIIHCFYCHIFKFLFVTNFFISFSFSPWRRCVFKPKYWAIFLNIYIYIFALFFCLVLHRLAVKISLLFQIFLQKLMPASWRKVDWGWRLRKWGWGHNCTFKFISEKRIFDLFPPMNIICGTYLVRL